MLISFVRPLLFGTSFSFFFVSNNLLWSAEPIVAHGSQDITDKSKMNHIRVTGQITEWVIDESYMVPR